MASSTSAPTTTSRTTLAAVRRIQLVPRDIAVRVERPLENGACGHAARRIGPIWRRRRRRRRRLFTERVGGQLVAVAGRRGATSSVATPAPCPPPPPPSLPATCRPKKKRQKKRRNAERKKLPDRPSCTQATPRKTNRSAPCRSIRSISITPEVRWTCNSSTVRIVGDSRANDEYRAQNSSGEGGVRVEYVSLIGHQKERQKAFGRRLAVPRSKFFFARAHTHTHKLMERGQISLSRRATVSSFWPFVCPKDSKRKRSAAGAAPIRFHFVDAPEIQRNRARWRLRQKKQIRGVGGGGGKKGRNRSAPEPTVGWYCQSARLIN